MIRLFVSWEDTIVYDLNMSVDTEGRQDHVTHWRLVADVFRNTDSMKLVYDAKEMQKRFLERGYDGMHASCFLFLVVVFTHTHKKQLLVTRFATS